MSLARFGSIGLLTVVLACGGSGGGNLPAAPSDLGYAVSPATYTRGVAIDANLPHSSGGAVDAYAIAPDLPPGLTLDSRTGVVAGTPGAVSPLTAYTVTASNAGGNTAFSLLIAVVDVPPAGLNYSVNPVIYTKGVAVAPNLATVSGGAVTRFTTSPALPAGLAFDSTSGAISGTPSVVAAQAVYHLKASNSGGSASFDLTLTVNDVPPSALTYSTSSAVYTAGSGITPNAPASSGGAVVTYRVAPALPSGLLLDPATGVISGAPDAPSASHDYTVTAVNSGGSTTCTLTIAVLARAPTNLVYDDGAPIYTRGVSITPNGPTNGGGAATSFSVSPALPAGLALDALSGVISGTPTALSPAANYTVTATNTGGSTTCVVNITVREAAPTSLAYATNPTAYSVGTTIQPNTPSSGGGAIDTYTVSPALPDGLSLDLHTGVITGTPTTLTPQATYVITGANAGGSTTCNFVTEVGPSPIPLPGTPVVTAATYATTGQTALQASTQDQGTANGTAYQWTVANGAITGGQGTPTITYTAGAVGTLALQVKVSNLSGSATGGRNVTVVDVPRARIFAQQQVLAGTRATASVADQANMTWQWTLSGPAAGAVTSGSTNVVTYTAGLTPGEYQLSVLVTSPAGGSASASRTLNVISNAFLGDVRASVPRYGHTVTELRDGRVLVAGGDDPHVVASPSAEVYDPWSGTWTPTGPMSISRSFHAAVLLADGRVLVAGGMDFTGATLDTAEIYDPDANTWSAAGQMNATRQTHTATLLPDGTVLVTGGFGLDRGGTHGGYLSSTELYDPAGHTWFQCTPMSTARSEHVATLLSNGLVLVAAGASASNTAGWLKTAELYDPAELAWTSVGNLTKPRTDATATLLPNGKVLVAGGFNASTPLNDGDVFNPGTGSWTATTNAMSAAHVNHAAALTPAGKVLVIGGSNDGTGARVESYDPATNRWTRMADLLAGRSYPRAIGLDNGKILVDGGRGVNGTMGSPELYDPASDSWSSGGSWSSARFGHTTTVLNDGSLLVAGGSGDAVQYMDKVERFDPATGSWTNDSKLVQGRLFHTASLLPDGRVLVVGGMGGLSTYLPTAELYSPATGAWTQTGSLTAARANHTATVLADGRVLVAGGDAGATTLDSAEIYDPSSGQWTSAGTMSTPRTGHTATLIPGGVLVVGGGTSNSYLKTVELYDPGLNAWTSKSPMISEHQNHTATLLPGGAILVMGGQGNGGITLPTVESYDPGTDTWTALVSMSTGRYEHVATLLPGGRVLVTGGRLNSAVSSHVADLYDPAGPSTASVPMAQARAYHTATVVDAAGTVLVLGGSPGSAPEYWKP